MKHSSLLGVAMFALAPMVLLPEASHAQVRIRDLQFRGFSTQCRRKMRCNASYAYIN
jgi:hypothetical protein